MGLEPDRPRAGYFAWVPVAGLGLDGRAFAERLFREERVQVGPGCVRAVRGGPRPRELRGRRRPPPRGAVAHGRVRGAAEEPEPPQAREPVVEEVAETKLEAVGEKPPPTFSRV